MTNEQCIARHLHNQSTISMRNASMTETKRAIQRASNRERSQRRRAQMSKEQREAERAYNRSYQRARRAHMTEAQRSHQREIMRSSAQRKRQQLLQSSHQATMLAATSSRHLEHINMTWVTNADNDVVHRYSLTTVPSMPSFVLCEYLRLENHQQRIHILYHCLTAPSQQCLPTQVKILL
ncbi:hypothetical protein KSP39_PZI013967 [Platanthera zijinensis]|uniref:Uncharacterized protein n=1 Tax=Platanthera zijinensis TaxID=2320716 RepID=A0AAP0BB77_9ASPA